MRYWWPASCWVESGSGAFRTRQQSITWSQRRRTTPIHNTHARPAAIRTSLVLEQVGELGTWMQRTPVLVTEETYVQVIGSRMGTYTRQRSCMRWSVDVRVQRTRTTGGLAPRDCRTWVTTTVCRRHQHACRPGIMLRCAMQTLLYHHRRRKDHSLTNWKPMKCREDRRDVVMTTSAGDYRRAAACTDWKRRGCTSADSVMPV